MARVLNVGLHGATLLTRFVFLFLLAKFLDPAEVGYYGLFVATVGYSIYFVGLDFYTYASRELVRAAPMERGRLLKGQAALSGLLYVALLPVAVVFLLRVDWPQALVWWFLPLVALEQFNQEMSRLLVALSEQLSASLILFVRQGSWAIVVVLLMAWHEDARSLNTVMALWVAAGVAAAACGVQKLRSMRTGGWRESVDWRWVRQGVGVSVAFLVATLALRGFQTIDRYWAERLGGIEVVGAYVLMLGVAGTLLGFLDAAVFSFTYPALIRHHLQGEHREARQKVLRLLWQTLVLSAAFAVFSWLLLPQLLRWIGSPVYLENIHWYPWLLSAMILNALGMIPHYALYARRADAPIIFSHLGSLVVFCLSTWAFSFTYSALAVAIGLNCAFASILLWKGYAYSMALKGEGTGALPPARA